MDKYVSEEESQLNIQAEVALGHADIDIFVTLHEIRSYERPVPYEVGTGGSIACQPIVHKNRIYFGACDHNFYCLDMDGNEMWHFGTGGPIVFDFSIHDDVIYFGCFDKNIYAISLEGELVWKFGTGGMIGSKPKVADGILYFGSQDKNLYAIDPKTGSLIWAFRAGDVICSDQLIYQGRIYFGSWDNNLYCLDAKTGKFIWKYAANNTIGSVVEYNGNLFFGSFDHHFRSVTPDGKLRWKFRTDGPIEGGVNYIVVDGIIYFSSRDKRMYAVDADTGKLIWKFPTNEIMVSPPIYDNGILYFGSGDSNLYVVDAKTGKLIWKKAFNLPAVSIAVYEDVIYIGCWDCNLYALSLKGKILWKFPTSLSFPAPIDLESQHQSEGIKIDWESTDIKKEKDVYKIEVQIGNYNDFSSPYSGISNAYLKGGEHDYVKKKKHVF